LLANQPFFASFILALGAVAVATRMIAIVALLALFTVMHMPAQSPGAATFDSGHSSVMAGQHPLTVLGAIGLSVLLEYIG
jgi:hypothetical protein